MCPKQSGTEQLAPANLPCHSYPRRLTSCRPRPVPEKLRPLSSLTPPASLGAGESGVEGTRRDLRERSPCRWNRKRKTLDLRGERLTTSRVADGDPERGGDRESESSEQSQRENQRKRKSLVLSHRKNLRGSW